MRAYLEGIGLLGPGLRGWQESRAALAGEQPYESAPTAIPASELLPRAERRRAGVPVRLALAAGAQAFAAAGRDAAATATVFTSSEGDGQILHEICSALASPGREVSPTRFMNSVHNAAAGYWSIGTSSHASYTAISAFHHTFGAGLLEAVVQIACEQQPVLYVAFDVEAKGALSTMAPSRGLLGVALVLAPASVARPGGRHLSMRIAANEPCTATPPRSAAAALVADNALAPCMPLMEALAADAPTTLQLTLAERAALNIQVRQA
jgi:hypothetical protein